MTETELIALLHYDHETGVVSRRVPAIGGRPRTKTEPTHSKGYLTIRVCGKLYLSHRLAWLCAYGRWPSSVIDHINGDRADNRLANLREATLCENQWNSKVRAHNATGVKGVQIKTVGAYTRYVAIIRANGKKEHLGSFKSLDEAAQAVQKRRMELHEDFARHA